jgi:hypothetical protein
MRITCSSLVLLLAVVPALSAFAFEGRIDVSVTHGDHVAGLLYTVATNCLRVESTETNRPYARNIVNLQTGDITLLLPRNRSFMRLKAASQNGPQPLPGASGPGSLPPGVGPPGGAPPGMPAMPMMPMPGGQMELKATGQTTNLLGYACTGYEIKQRGETMQIWATDQLLAFQPWLQSQPHHFGPRRIGEQWGELLKAKKLFPLLATLRYDKGSERYRFEVKAIRPEHITDDDGKLFQPPTNYFEAHALQF